MKLYSKNLSNLHALKKEKERLQKELNGRDEGKDKTVNNPLQKEEKRESFISGLLSGATSGSMLTTLLNAAPTVIDIVKRGSLFPKKNTIQKAVGTSKTANIVSIVAKEFVGGYIKWKILELTYKGIKKALKSDTVKELKKKKVPSLKKLFKK